MKPVIYQLVVRLFGNTNTTNARNGTIDVNGCGKFDDITPRALRSLRDLGVTHVWLTGCLRQATLTGYPDLGLPADDPRVVKGVAGSFYAVRDYFDVCPDYAREPANRLAEFEALVQRVHDAGMKALIDFVPNHVARGYHSVIRPEADFGEGDDATKFFDPQNHFFYLVDPPGQQLRLPTPEHWAPPVESVGPIPDGPYPLEDGSPGRPPKATGNNAATATPSAHDWYETVKLNYGYDFTTRTGHYGGEGTRPRTWDAMDEVLAYWQARGVDGFRCDFAHYVPAEAWEFLIGRARERDGSAVFVAEAYPWVGSGDPVTDMRQLVDVGFDAVYHDASYNSLKRIYQGTGSQDDYHHTMASLTPAARRHYLTYLENHDERRIASPVEPERSWGESGFGSMRAGCLLAPLQMLMGPGPVLVFNGQEVGEPGAGDEGFSGEDGRTTLFDYWCMPELAKWVNGHAYDGGLLNEEQRRLRAFYGALLSLCQDEAVRHGDYFGLKYFNRPDRFDDCPDSLFTYARFVPSEGRVLLIAANFDRSASVTGRLRLPPDVLAQVKLLETVSIRLRLNEHGAQDERVAELASAALATEGFEVTLAAESAQVYVIA